MAQKWVYSFGNGHAEGKAEMRELLGGKGANLAEMSNLGLAVPPGFTISTDVCAHYTSNQNQYPKALEEQVNYALKQIEKDIGKNKNNISSDESVRLVAPLNQFATGPLPSIANGKAIPIPPIINPRAANITV